MLLLYIIKLFFFSLTNLLLFFFPLFTRQVNHFIYIFDWRGFVVTHCTIHARTHPYIHTYVHAFILTFILYSFRVLYTVIKPRLLCLIKICFINKKTNRQWHTQHIYAHTYTNVIKHLKKIRHTTLVSFILTLILSCRME